VSAFDGLRHRLRVLFRRGAWERDLAEELRFHQALEEMQQRHGGAAPADARATARRRLGSPTYHREETRRMTGFGWLASLFQDGRFAARSLRRDPVFTSFVVATLALGIGANAAMFGIVDRLLLRGPAHVRDPGAVVRLYLTDHAPGMREYTTGTFGYVTYDVLRAGTHAFDDLAVYNHPDVIVGQGADARKLPASFVSASFFPLLGVKPALGRFFTADEDATTGARHVAVISDGLWSRAFARNPHVLGQTIVVTDEPYTVVGVAPRGFTGAELKPVDLWLPMSVLGPRVTQDWTHAWDTQWLLVIGRLKPGVSLAEAAAEATATHRRAYGDNPAGSFSPQARLSVRPLRYDEDGEEPAEDAVSRWLMGVTVIVLLIACANVTNLLLARGVRRRREVTVRLALGVGRWRLARLLVVESALLAIAGSVAGLGVAYVLASLLRTVLLPAVAWTSPPVDGRVLVAAAAMAGIVGLVIGLAPALRATRADVSSGLKAGAREGGGRRSRLRTALTVAQAALSVVLLVGAGLFVRSLWNVRSLDLGFDSDRVLSAEVEWPGLGRIADPVAHDRERARRKAFYARALERVRALPGVEAAALTVGLPFRMWFSVQLRLPGQDSLPRFPGGTPNISAVTSDYFATMGTRLLRGRTFTTADHAGSERVAIVSSTMARTLWPGANPLGECLLIRYGRDQPEQPCTRIVGVVADVRRSRLREPPHMQYYVPLGQEAGFGGTLLLVRPKRGDPADLAATVRNALFSLDRDLPYVNTQPVQDLVDPQIRPWRLGASVFGFAGLLALLVAAVGLYGLWSYLVAQRTQEIGVRIALGARAGRIVGLVLREGLALTLLGVAIGAVLALAAGRYLQALLFDTSPRDPAVYAIVAASMLVVAILASVLPAWRANRIDPMTALRVE
jgi:putative ABC transport system permease protein